MIFLPIITLIIIYFNYSRKNDSRLDVVKMLIITYLIMSAASLLLEFSGFFPSIFPMAFEPMIYLSVCFAIVFWGFTGFNVKKITFIRVESLYLYRAMEFFLLIGGFLAIIFFLPFAIIALTGDIAENRNYVVVSGTILEEWGIINSIFSLLSNLFILSQVCAFLNLVPRGGKKNVKRACLLLISSLSYVIYIFSYVGRDGVVYWLMSYLFCFLLFRDFVARDDLKRFNRFVASIAAILLGIFFVISIARFSERSTGTSWQIANYAGQQLRNFNDHYMVDAPLQYGWSCFPEVLNLMSKVGVDVGPNIDTQKQNYYFLSKGVEPWVFTTFIGHLLLDFGKVGLLVYLGLMSLITRKILKRASNTGVFEFSNLVMFVLLFQIVYWGVFYFRQYSANYYILCMVLIFIFFKASKASRLPIFFSKPV